MIGQGMTSDYRALCAELATTIVMDVVYPPASRDVRNYARLGKEKGRLLDHAFQTVFESAFANLVSLGILERLNSEVASRNASGGNFRLTMDIDQVNDFVLLHADKEQLDRVDLMGSFVALSAGHHASVPSTRKPFLIAAEYERLFEELRIRGFVLKDGRQFIWTNKTASAMRRASLWNDDLQSIHDLDEQEADLAWRTIPTRIYEICVSGDILSLAIAISHHWRKSQWYPIERTGDHAPLGDGLALARRIEERFKHSQGRK